MPATEITEGREFAHLKAQPRIAPPGLGVPLPAASERLGHSSVRVTVDVYAHALRGQDDEAARRWEEFQRDSGAERLLPAVTTRPVTH